MTQYFLEGQYKRIALHHIRMEFSSDIEEVGRFKLGKVARLISLLIRIGVAWFRLRPDVLYYTPAGPNMIPFLRDCAVLIMFRWLFRHTVFHFHAAGLPELFCRLPAPLRLLFRLAYQCPDMAISISRNGLRDAEFLRARSTVVVPNGIPNIWETPPVHSGNARVEILFLGMVCEEKGVGILIEACHILKARGLDFVCKVAGRAASEEEFGPLRDRAASLDNHIEFLGPLIGEAKWARFAEADIFCFPSHYASESFGLVVVEAMMANLPVVTSDWRALPEIVIDGETGFLCPVQSPEMIAEKLALLICDSALRARMGKAGRARFLENYTLDVFRSNMEVALSSLRS